MTSWLGDHVRVIPDHPEPGVSFKDLTPVMGRPEVFARVVDELAERVAEHDPDVIVGMEARGFIFGAPVAHRLGVGFVPVRKPGKLPGPTVGVTYDLEYGSDGLEIHRDGVAPGSRVGIVDDVLATGGTAKAVLDLLIELEATPTALTVVIELAFLDGRKQLDGLTVDALMVEGG